MLVEIIEGAVTHLYKAKNIVHCPQNLHEEELQTTTYIYEHLTMYF